VNNRLTITAAIAAAAASTGLFPLLVGGKWFWGGLGAIIVVAAIGTATRMRAVRALPAVVCLLCALAGLLIYLNVLYSATSSYGHLIPSGSSLAHLWRLGVQGLNDTQRYSAPVPALPGIVLIATAGIGLVAALTDLIAVRLRRCALAGLPLLVLFSVPVATGAGKDTLGDAFVFCIGMAGYLALLSADGQERLRLWGKLVTPWNAGPDEPAEELASGPSTRALAASGRRVGLAAVVVALFVPLLVPDLHAQKLFPSSHTATGIGNGPGSGSAPDPWVQMTGQLQESKPSEVLTYHTTDPQYLQMYVLGTLTTTNWVMGPLDGGVRLDPQTGLLPKVPGLTGGNWPAVQTRIRIRTNLPQGSFLPAPYPSLRLNPGDGWEADPGTLMLYGSPSASGLSYTLTSLNVDPSQAQLRAAPAGAGPMGAYLAVPQPYRPLASLARTIVGSARTPYDQAVVLQNWFRSDSRFSYSLNVTGPGGAAGLTNFLDHTRRGYCQQFAFAMAVLARLLGIPSRVVVGYTAGTFLGNGTYEVKTSDAHAWPELYFRGFGWLRMEPTPSGGAIGQGTASAPVYTQPPVGIGPGGIPATTPSITSPAAGAAGRRPVIPPGLKGKTGSISGQAASLPAAARGGGLPVPLIVLGALLAAALITPRAARSLLRRRRWLSARGDTARAHAAWAELLDDLADYGIRHGPGETPRAVATRVTALLKLPEPGRGALLRVASAEERASYAREPGSAETLAADVLAVRGRVSASVTRPARWRARLVPASAVTRTRRGLAHALDAFGWLDVAAARTRSRLPRARTADEG
jgi:transglutaminase-like putative cysteine protease